MPRKSIQMCEYWWPNSGPKLTCGKPYVSSQRYVDVQAAQACDASGVKANQGVTQLLGAGNAADQLCSANVTFTAGKPGPVQPGAATQQLVAQYNADAVGWARSVTLNGGARPISLLLAPIGDSWRVIGVFS